MDEFADESANAPTTASDALIAEENTKQESQDQDMLEGGDDAMDTEEGQEASQAVSPNPIDAPDAPLPEKAEDGDEDEDAQPGTKDQTPAATEAAPAQTQAQIQSTARSHLIEQNHAIILPSYSAWFDMHEIHNSKMENPNSAGSILTLL
jgi:SWI/SNF related-matrix-associated actin-dependent regulator of chromatin subfamily C